MRRSAGLMIAGLAANLGVLSAGCSKEEPTTGDYKPREAPAFAPAEGTTTQTGATLPAGHPPIGSDTGTTAEIGNDSALAIRLRMPTDFQPKPARMMTLQVYAAPRVEGDPEDADVALSELGTRVPFKMNVDRWCSQFELPAGQTCETAARQQTLEGTRYPTTVVEIAGNYKGSAMMGPQNAAPKENYRMLAAEIVTPSRPYYIKMVGPAKTVEKWKAPLIDAVKAAE